MRVLKLGLIFPFISQIFASDMFLRIVSSYAKAQAYFRVMFVFKCLVKLKVEATGFQRDFEALRSTADSVITVSGG